MSKQPTKAQLLRALNHIHTRLEGLRHGSNGNAWETLGGIQYWVEETLGKPVKSMVPPP